MVVSLIIRTTLFLVVGKHLTYINCKQSPFKDQCQFQSSLPSGTVEYVAGECFFFSFVHGEKKRTWKQARRFCQELGSDIGEQVDLAIVGNETLSDSESQMLEKIRMSGERVWLGGSDINVEGTWTWVPSGRSMHLFDPSLRDGTPDPKSFSGDGDCLVASIAIDSKEIQFGDWHCNKELDFVCRVREDFPLHPPRPYVQECCTPWIRVGEQCFRVVDEGTSVHLTWASARTYCNAQAPGGDLADPSSIKALDVYMLNNGYGNRWAHWRYWVLGSDSTTEGESNANGGVGQNCFTFSPGTLRDHIKVTLKCEETNRFICEIPITIW